MDAVPNVYIDVLDVACHLGMEFDFLIRKELTGDGECVGQRRAPNLHDCGPWGCIR